MKLDTLPVFGFDVIRRIGDSAVTAYELGINGSVMASLVESGFLIAEKDESPTMYRLSPMGHGAHAVLTAPLAPRDNEGMISRIQRTVAHYYDIPQIEMVSQRRARVVARPRQIAMYLCRMLTTHSLPTIGHYFGGRDHTTVMHAIRTIDDLREVVESVDIDVLKLLKTLDAKPIPGVPERLAA